jgi:hypothetical protein
MARRNNNYPLSRCRSAVVKRSPGAAMANEARSADVACAGTSWTAAEAGKVSRSRTPHFPQNVCSEGFMKPQAGQPWGSFVPQRPQKFVPSALTKPQCGHIILLYPLYRSTVFWTPSGPKIRPHQPRHTVAHVSPGQAFCIHAVQSTTSHCIDAETHAAPGAALPRY